MVCLPCAAQALRGATRLELLQAWLECPTVCDLDVLRSLASLRRLWLCGLSRQASGPTRKAVKWAAPQVESLSFHGGNHKDFCDAASLAADRLLLILLNRWRARLRLPQLPRH